MWDFVMINGHHFGSLGLFESGIKLSNHVRLEFLKLHYKAVLFNVDFWKLSTHDHMYILRNQNTGKYCFILQILILELFTDIILILILMLSIKNLILIYWYFQYFTVSVFFVLNHCTICPCPQTAFSIAVIFAHQRKLHEGHGVL